MLDDGYLPFSFEDEHVVFVELISFGFCAGAEGGSDFCVKVGEEGGTPETKSKGVVPANVVDAVDYQGPFGASVDGCHEA